MKTKNLSKKAIEHLLIDLEYTSNRTLEELADAPFLFIENRTIKPVFSVKEYTNSSSKELNEHQILSLQKELSKESIKLEKLVLKLVNKLNSNKYKNLSNYEVAFNYNFYDSNKSLSVINECCIYPVTNEACGGISMKVLEFILEFCTNNDLQCYFSYCNVHGETEKYRTVTPCVYIY